jgi:hypothetical protein
MSIIILFRQAPPSPALARVALCTGIEAASLQLVGGLGIAVQHAVLPVNRCPQQRDQRGVTRAGFKLLWPGPQQASAVGTS